VIGPANPSTNYEAGLLIEGFDDPPQVMMTYNPKYYLKQFEDEGLKKAKDLFAHRLPTNSEVPEIINKIAARAEKRHSITYRYLNKKMWAREVEIMLDIYNDAWENNWGFVPMTENEFRHTANDLKMIAQENLALIAEVNGEAAGMLVALPDINQVLIKNPSGNLLPFGIFKLLNHKKYTNRMRIPIMGVKQKYQKIGLSSLLLQKIREEAVKTHYKDCECSWILEDNHNMNKPLFTYGSEVYKKYRLYQGTL
jgi:GNAT superfamily N-acetyltransferase